MLFRSYNEEKDWFEFSFDYRKFTTRADDTRTQWILCTYGPRIKSFRNPDTNNKWNDIEINLTAEFKQLFDQY